MVPEYPPVTLVGVELLFKRERRAIGFQNRVRAYFPQFLYVAQHDESKIQFVIIPQRGVVDGFTGLEVIRAISHTFMVIREDHKARVLCVALSDDGGGVGSV
jgi:hypothetical protein